MKRIIAILLALFLPLTALASTDVSAMTTEELLELHRAIKLELQARDADTQIHLGAGEHLVGKDIPAGTFYFMQIDEYWSSSTLRHYSDASKTIMLSEDRMASDSGAICMLTLQENELLTTSGNTLLMSTTYPETEEQLPGMVTIPMGDYTVGEHLPAGSYSCHFSKTKGHIYIFQNQKEFEKGSGYFEHYYQLTATTPTLHLTLKEGSVLKITAPILMKQESGQLFFN